MLKEYINKLLPEEFLARDSYKDLDGRGFVERYLSIFGEELDESIWAKIEDLPNIIDPYTTSTEYLNLITYTLGNIEVIYNNEEDLRNLLTYLISIYKIKGTKQSYISLLRNIGLEAEIEEIPTIEARYDTEELRYDTEELRRDTGCQTCSKYILHLTGSGEITIDQYNKIERIVSLVEPINAKLSQLIYNEEPLDNIMIKVEIDEEGNLIYDNTADPSIILTLDENGDLHIEGPNANRYHIGEDGNLYYTTIQ